ncbi:cyclopropane-fatty-acyl-phospholipid synthase family protein [uncultured Corynebacterium sp.]|uniref:SAM-dependent methyltransferase n=1 Tax=uncultured Corynebacterium sp. TaxID=159447 RepID=UPI0025FC62E6|nr:class I SAM-dependent methyltransferase [uncultured Corynebacterium sp.]
MTDDTENGWTDGPQTDATQTDATQAVAAHWETEYAGDGKRWSGAVNATTADVVATLPVRHGATALELGCGEGADAVWLAGHGYRVTAVDISATALERGKESARVAGVADAVDWVAGDLSEWTTPDTFDLATASFLHSRVELPRTRILRRAADRVRPGGHLLIVSHAFETPEDVPPWTRRWSEESEARGEDTHDPFHGLLTPAEEVAALGLDPDEWETSLCEVRSRTAVGPDGSGEATVKDGIVLMARR